MAKTQIDKVNKYYDSTAVDYKILWTGPKDHAIHFGYFDSSVKSHQDSLLKMNEVLAKLAFVSKDDRVLDAGCGYGGSAIWLAENIGCEVVGLTVVPHQVKEATKFAKQHFLTHKVSYKREDYAHTSFSNNSFNVVWALESVVHAESKKDFVIEGYRLLKTRGRILICEYMLREDPPLSGEERKIIGPWLKGWAMPSLLTPSEYRSILANVGFKDIKLHDLTENVRLSLRRLGKILMLGFPVSKVLRKLKLLNAERYGNIEGSVCLGKALESGLWRYVVIAAEKP